MPRIRDRATGDLLVIMIASTICSVVLLSGGTIAIIKIINPNADVTAAINSLSDVINTLIGLMAGFLAGRTDRVKDESSKPDNKSSDSSL